MAKKRVRRPTTCEACGEDSYNGRVCRDCSKFWGKPIANVLAAVALRRRLDNCVSFDQVASVLGELVDTIVPDCLGKGLPTMIYGSGQRRRSCPLTTDLPAAGSTQESSDAQ
jgi:hypothetical protein